MKCHEFEDNLAEYVAGRLAPTLQSRMQAHAALCLECARKEEKEGELRSMFREFAPVSAIPDLWPRLEGRLPPQPRRTPFKWPWVYGGTAMAFAACAAMLMLQVGRPLLPTENKGGAFHSRMIDARAEQEVVQMVNKNRQLRTIDSEALVANLQSTGEEESAILLGGSKQ